MTTLRNSAYVVSHVNIKLFPTDEDKRGRVEWAKGWVRPSAGGGHKFHHFEDLVHLNEKGFYLCQNGQRYYICDNKDLPVQKVKHKSHIPKVVFLATVARPRYIPNDSRTFTGKIRILPFTDQRQAQCNSRNRAPGTKETKCVEVNKEIYKWKIIDGVIPAVRDGWPAGARNQHIWT